MTDHKNNPDQDKPAANLEGTEKSAEKEGMPSSVDAILQERLKLEQAQAALDQMIKDKFQRNITVLFTDIKGSTSFFETYGDVEGRAMVQRHNAILFPKIEAHGGKIIKTIGDAIMATFEDPAEGVKAAIEMQKALWEYNQQQDQKHKKILVRMGLNYGPAVVEEKDVFGDAVNVAARVESQADAEQILISEELYKQVRSDDEILLRFFGEVTVKGKAEPVKIYRVLWSEEQLVAEAEFKKAATRRTVDLRGKVIKGKVIEIVVSREAAKMKLSVFERQRGEEKTVSQYDEVKLDDKLINAQCEEIVNLLNRANKRGKITKEIIKQLAAAGQLLFDHLFTREAKEKILNTQAEHLTLRLDDHLVHIPWELIFDGKQFLCQRFSMGRIVATRQKVSEVADRHIAKPLRMLVIADPRGDLPASKREGTHIRDELDHEHEFINVNLKASEVSVNYLKSKIRDYDIIHYAGHALYNKEDPGNSAWLLADGQLTSNEIKAMTGKKPMPALVFANGCQSGQTEEWKIESDYENAIFGLANAFLISGVQHYIGTFWDILDEPGHDFALAFYREMITGCTVGEAVRRARLALIDKYGEETIVWASYMLYGDPTFSYLAEAAEVGESTAEQVALPAGVGYAAGVPGQAPLLRGAETVVIAKESGLSKATLGIMVAILVVLIGGVGYFILRGSKEPSAPANVPVVKVNEKAAQLIAQGLAASQAGNKEEAIKFYEEALKADPQNIQAAINLGQGYLAMGNPAKAKEAFATAATQNPNDPIATTLLAQATAMLANSQDAQKQAEINRLTTELAERWRTKKIAPPKRAGDEWTSQLITLTFLDFDPKGQATPTMEGENEFLKIALTQALRESGRVEVVEREKIDRILQELNLASSELASEETKVQLGRLFGARMIATGSYIKSGNEIQVNLRLIETETSLAKVAISEVYTDIKSPADLAKAVAASLLKQIQKEYPIQGKIIEVQGEMVKVNVGSKVGVTKGMKLEILDKDEIKIGLLEVTEVGPEVSQAKVVEKPAQLAKDTKVREVVE